MNSTIAREYHGYFSKKQHALCRFLKHAYCDERGKTEYKSNNGYNVWLTRDGREVKTSEVVRTRNDEFMKSRWSDTQYVGHIVKWLRYVRYDTPLSLVDYFEITNRDDKTENDELIKMIVNEKHVLPPDSFKFEVPVGSGINAVRLKKPP